MNKNSDSVKMLKENIVVRTMSNGDIDELVAIWLDVSIKAHDFIPKKYWVENKTLMKADYLPNAEIYVAEVAGRIDGFVALIKNHIAAFFVRSEQQGKGIGTILLDYARELRSELTLNVYQKNKKSVSFYQAKGFEIAAETWDERTQEMEFIMRWVKPS
ncbi:putative acetyltransferase [Sphingobacterium allocomposti]|jgi:putative acetyltransferase|uniref:Putative acetyltransferase n=1 Tax=Sphingobacterium allocomposti TaxID=415956 RepID=A0A5S5D1P1_9SPHI|nr:N-acetyltransferase [Sphingobacterium composti Yoo et al. 2007 non Ten et al. 2007]TYP89294.1 putative acetyltransferase [Sphingobacterium composti Yoo et al. 2007 non Ten et al. 2007]